MKTKRDMTGADQELGRCGDAWDCEPTAHTPKIRTEACMDYDMDCIPKGGIPMKTPTPTPDSINGLLQLLPNTETKDYIVRAVNAHEELVEAVRDGLSVTDDGAIRRRMEQALAKAEGK